MQHDFDIANANGGTVRGDLNNAFESIVTLSSGATEPSVKYPFQFWADTGANQLKIRNTANNAWLVVGTLDATGFALAPKANPTLTSPEMSNPTLTGTTAAPTPATSDSSTKIATTAMVQLAAAAQASTAIGTITTVTTKLDGTNIQGRTIYINDSGPSGGSNGDVWLEY